MLETLTRFAECCRAWDLRVSTVEVLDCANHLSICELHSQDDFKAVLGANFAKSRREQKKFERIYDLYFHDRPIPTAEESAQSISPQINEIIDDLNMDRPDGDLENALADFVSGNPSSFLEQVVAMQTAEERQNAPVKSNLAQLSGKLTVMFAILKMRDNIRAMIDQRGYDPELEAGLDAHFTRALETAQELVYQEPDHYNDTLEESKSGRGSGDSLAETSFASLSPAQIIAMKEIVEKLAKKLKDRISRRYVTKNRGMLDIKKTLRNAGKYQGVPMDLRFKNKSMKKSRIVTLCDVSGSVWSTARFMLHFLYALQECFSQVRSFIFVSQLAEISEFFQNLDIDDALDKAMSGADINYNDYTDYGMAFQSFKSRYLSELNKRTTLIIIGDGRSNYQNPQGNILAEFREKVKRIIWLTPEAANTWYTGDSEMQTYKKHCHEVRTCMNINHLEEFIKKIVS